MNAAEKLNLEAILGEVLEYLDDRMDVVDGDYGEPEANQEMQLGSALREAMAEAGLIDGTR